MMHVLWAICDFIGAVYWLFAIIGLFFYEVFFRVMICESVIAIWQSICRYLKLKKRNT